MVQLKYWNLNVNKRRKTHAKMPDRMQCVCVLLLQPRMYRVEKMNCGATGRQLVVSKSTFHHLSVNEKMLNILCMYLVAATDFTNHCMFSESVCRSIGRSVCLHVDWSVGCSIFSSLCSLLNECALMSQVALFRPILYRLFRKFLMREKENYEKAKT